jgi:hypothetical protein
VAGAIMRVSAASRAVAVETWVRFMGVPFLGFWNRVRLDPSMASGKVHKAGASDTLAREAGNPRVFL